ncbi:MAG: SPFH domain-containing protein [Erysipelotrichia bacterium]|nr:SPFH domain-containing protein [Erysipelotrichia bacterium]NCC55266.1 SPFH domain-containing protein [Erysipelotrichia bacterium]
MGLIKAAFDGARKTLADQWLEYYYCETLSNDVLIKKGSKVVNTGSNTKGSENIITNGSGFAINEGQGLLIVEDGKIVEFSMEPGRFTWEESSEPSLFDRGFKGLAESFKTFGTRFKHGGSEAKDQRVYYVNIKEILDNKFGSASPMPYKDPTYRGIYIRYFGQYSFKISDPIRFYTNIAGNVENEYTKTELMSQCQAEFVNAIDTALAKCSDEGYQFNDLPKKQMEIAAFMNDALDEVWHQKRGLEIEMVAIEKVTPDDESRARIEKIDDAIMLSDQRVAAGRLAQAQATAMENASANEAGAMQGFLGMGFAAQAGGMNTGNLFANTQPQENNPLFNQNNTQSEQWTCACGKVNDSKFCSECGKAKPSATWTCSCGNENQGNFCSQCGHKKPE